MRAALAAGMEVTAVTRDPRKLEPRPNLTAVKADVLDRAELQETQTSPTSSLQP